MVSTAARTSARLTAIGGVGLQFGTLDLCAGGRAAIVTALTTPQFQNQR
jgi:hypothetical protein